MMECSVPRLRSLVWIARNAVLNDEANGVLSHRQGLLLILPVGDDFGQCGNSNGKAAIFLGFEDDCEFVRLIGHRISLDV
jgi:hypothetical protein